MEKEQIIEEINIVVGELIRNMGFDVELETKSKQDAEGEEDLFVCDIKTQESNFLIGQYGMNLQSLQYIARLLIRKKILEPVNFILDVNSYRKEKNETIARMAVDMADMACIKGETVFMRPMSAYERRIAHMELAKNKKIKSESVGDGDDRRIVISPIGLKK